MQSPTIQLAVRVRKDYRGLRISRENNIIQIDLPYGSTKLPNERSRPNHRKQTNGGDDLRFRLAPIR